MPKPSSRVTFALSDAAAFMRKGPGFFDDKPIVTRFGKLRIPQSSNEASQCTAIHAIMRDYARREDPERPLSIAVFGPPGSGKSFAVEEIVGHIAADLSGRRGGDASGKGARGKGRSKKFDVDTRKLNVSQFQTPDALGVAMRAFFEPQDGDAAHPELRILFLDEFDAALGGTPLGWLKSFLAPMQDGKFLCEGRQVAVGKSVLVFAGGTSHTYEEFARLNDPAFTHSKGPDFVSRLRGYIDVEGINKYGPERYLRRALVLHHQLGKREPALATGDGRRIDRQLLEELLAGAHYIHGARSLEALLDMCCLTGISRKAKFTRRHLPNEPLMKLHVSRGPLDGWTVGVSAGQDASSKSFFEGLTKELFERGASLAHGGDLLDSTCPLGTMLEQLSQLPDELISRDGKRIRNYLAHPSQLRPGVRESRNAKVDKYVEFFEMKTLSDTDLEELGRKPEDYFLAIDDDYDVFDHRAWALSLFRMRLRLAQEIDALVVVGGKTREGWGRFPGVAEEAMLAMAFGKPVYVLGMRQPSEARENVGGAEALGHVLGLSAEQQKDDEFLQPPDDPRFHYLSTKLAEWSARFAVPAKRGLPRTLGELEEYLRDRALGTASWPDNGLTAGETRKLFDTPHDEVARAVGLVITGITRLARAPAGRE